MRWIAAFGAALLICAFPGVARAQDAVRPDQTEFRGLFEELIEIDTTLAHGSCTRAAEAMGARLKAAGYADGDVRVVVPDGHPTEGNLVAVLRGTDRRARPMLLLAHIDVVEAKREDWTRDPFTFVEENGYFFGRGVVDDKAMAAIFVDSLIRLRREGFRPRRDLKLALTCGEETSDAVNGVQYLLEHHRPLIDAAFALNEGAGGRLDANGNRIMLEVQAGEKIYQDFTLEVTNPGGHSSRPQPVNAIYQLAAALMRVQAYEFPAELNPATTLHLQRMADIVGGEEGATMRAVADPRNAEALARLAREPRYNAMLRTTFVATLVNAGHAPNALPQRARANVNCRMMPGRTAEETQAALIAAIADPSVSVTLTNPPDPVGPPPPLGRDFLGPVETVAGRMWPGTPVVPTMLSGATDGRFLNHAGIPTYGLSGLFGDPDGNGVHGLNERLRVRSLMEGRDFLHDVVQIYAMRR